MMNARIDWRLIAAMFICLALQMTVVTWFSVGDIAPNLCFLFLSFFAFQINYHQIFFMAFMVGFLRDLLTQSFFGIDTASLVLGCVVLHQIASRFDRDDSWVQLWGTFVFSFCSLTVYLILSASIQSAWPLDVYLFLKAFLITIYTTMLVFLGFPLLRYCLGVRVPVKQYELF